MQLIEFTAVDNYGNENKIFINPEHVESLYSVTNKNRIGIGMVSGNQIELANSLNEVIDKLGISVQSTDYKRTDREH
jgi:hypothetical protein